MTLKLNGSSSGSVSIDAPASTTGGADVALTLPVNDGDANQVLQSNGSGTLSWATIGITEVDQWYLSANVTSNGDITSNLARANFTGAASPLGTGISESSGVFSFPSTGKWLIFLQARFSIDGSDNCDVVLKATTDNSSYSTVAIASDGNNGSGAREGSAAVVYFLDVTDVSQVKVKFAASSLGGSSYVAGTGSMTTGLTFIRIGDT